MKHIKWISNGVFGIGIILSVTALVRMFLLRRSLPAGVCPVDESRWIVYSAIAFLLCAFILSLFEKKEESGK